MGIHSSYIDSVSKVVGTANHVISNKFFTGKIGQAVQVAARVISINVTTLSPI